MTLGFEDATEETRRFFEGFVWEHVERMALREGFRVIRVLACPSCRTTISDEIIRKRRARGLDWLPCPVCDVYISFVEDELFQNPALSPITQEMGRNADLQREREVDQSIVQGKIATQDFDVFLCHNGKDKALVKQIGNELKKYGILPWLDEWELRPGTPWQKLLERQIKQIKAAAVFVGKNGVGPWQQMEQEAFLREFVRRGCPVIPVLLPNAPKQPKLPLFLQGMTWVDFRQQEPDPMRRLRWGITGRKELMDERMDGEL